MNEKKTFVGARNQVNPTESNTAEPMTFDRLSENINGAVHNVKSLLMAVNGYVDLLGAEEQSEVYEHAKESTEAVETILGNLAYALRAYRKTEPEELSLNACVRSTVELLRTNQVLKSMVMFELELARNDGIYAVSAEVMARLDGFIAGVAEHVLSGRQYTCTVATVCESERVCVRIGDEEIGFSRSGL